MFTIQLTLFSITFVMLIIGLGRFSKSIFRWHPVDLLFHFKISELTTRLKKIFETPLIVFHFWSEVIDQPNRSDYALINNS